MDGCVALPAGFRFHPTDDEIIADYLYPKVINPNFTATAIVEVDLNKCEPWDLQSKAKMGEKDWYFFCRRDRKYPTGTRTNRATDAGYWKATGKDKEILRDRRNLVGMKKILVFYTGRVPKGVKSNWVMHEYRIDGNSPFSNNLPRPAKDEWVVSRVFHKGNGAKKNPILQGDLARMNSFRYLLDSPNLPPMMESTPFFNSNNCDDMNNFNFNMMGLDKISTNFSNINDIPTPSFDSPSSYLLNQNNQCKVEQFPNHSMVSDDTGLSTDRKTEISSVVSKHDLDYLDLPMSAIPDLDLDNMWKCFDSLG